MAGRECRNRHRVIALPDLSPFPRESRFRTARWRARLAGCTLGWLGILNNGLSNRGGPNSIALAPAVDLRPYDRGGDFNDCDISDYDLHALRRGRNRCHQV